MTAPGVVIVQDWFQGFHGAERVVDVIHRDVYSRRADVMTFQAARELLPVELAEAIVAESRLARLPGVRQRQHQPGYWRYLLPLMPRYFRGLDLGAYSVVICSSHACTTQVVAPREALKLCYCHTPMRYAWLPQTDPRRSVGPTAFGLRKLSARLRRLDLEASRTVDHYLANSSAVKDRVKRFYGRDAEVIHPPVDLDDLDPGQDKDPAEFLWVHRLVPYKRPELVIEAFRGLPYRLTMVGVGPMEKRLRARLPSNVTLEGWLSRSDLAARYARASGFIHLGEEDFGISMVEALGAGAPVLALDKGGARDVVRHDRDGILLEDPSTENVRAGIDAIARRDWDRPALAARAAEFSRASFVRRFTDCLTDLGHPPPG